MGRWNDIRSRIGVPGAGGEREMMRSRNPTREDAP